MLSVLSVLSVVVVYCCCVVFIVIFNKKGIPDNCPTTTDNTLKTDKTDNRQLVLWVDWG